MKLAELALLCIKETNRNEDYVSLTVENLSNGSLLENPTYTADVFNVMLSINKAIARLSTADKIPYKEIVIENGNKEEYVIDLKNHRDIKNIKSVYIIKNGEPKTVVWYFYPDKKLTISTVTDKDIHIIYSPIVKQFGENDYENNIDLLEYGIDDEMCNYISYFAKSELYETRDPDRCKRYLNYFEQYLTELKRDNTYPTQDHVENTYTFE